MRRYLVAGSALLMASTALAAPGHGNGKGEQGNGGGKPAATAQKAGNAQGGGAGKKAERPKANMPRGDDGDSRNKGNGNAARQANVQPRGNGNANANAGNPAKDKGTRGNNAAAVRSQARNEPNRGAGNGNSNGSRNTIELNRAAVRGPDRYDPVRDVWRGRDYGARERLIAAQLPDHGQVRGCPPGLRAKNNGCLPPGQAKKLIESRPAYIDWFPDFRSGNYAIYDGYMLRYAPGGGSILNYIPLLGGALTIGNVWPDAYISQPVPTYYRDYYRYDDGYDYRYADHVVYGLDPQTNAIESIVGLLAGDDWVVGQPMPTGYDVYNVPYDYRDRYADGPDSWYRYSDGYLYQVDPTTRLVQAVIDMVV